MNAGRSLAVAGLGLAVVLLVAQTGAFSTIEADRSVQVTVGDDQSAYLGVETESVSVPGNATTSATLATLTNRFGSSIDVSVAVSEESDSPPELTNVDGPGTLSSGESGPVEADVTCDDSASEETVSLEIVATGTDVSAELTQSVDVTCEPVADDTDAETEEGADTETDDDTETESN